MSSQDLILITNLKLLSGELYYTLLGLIYLYYKYIINVYDDYKVRSIKDWKCLGSWLRLCEVSF